jgi:putative FmdB family regulatory protein
MLFDFCCQICNLQFEDLVNKDEPNPECPMCGSPTDKLLSTPQAYFGTKTEFVNHFAKRNPGLKPYLD